MPIEPSYPNPLATRYRSAGYWPQHPLDALFGRTTQRFGDREAIVDGDRRLTFAALDALVERAARGLGALGLGPGDVVAYQLPNWWEAAVVFLATLRLGATVNPLLPIFRTAELRFTLHQSGARALVIPGTFRGCDHRALVAELRHELPALRAVIVTRDHAPAGMHAFGALLDARIDAARPLLPADPECVALLMYTSGTTAAPKGVLHTHNSLAAEVLSLERVHQLTPADRTLMPSPLTHISGVLHGILTPALLGTCAVLMERWDASRGLDLIAAEGITYMVGAPTFLQELVAAHEAHPAAEHVRSLRLFSCGGAGVPPALLERARAHFPNCIAKRVYGSTEFPTLTTTGAGDAATHGLDTEGRAIWPAEVRIAGAGGAVLPAGAEGEVQGRGPECCAGYLDATLNDDAFTADGWFRTGDLGTLDATGYLRLTGRIKDIVIRKGEKISVKEVEDAIAAHPAITEVVVVARPDPHTGERACAVVRVRPSMQVDLPALTAFLADHGLARQKWPEDLVIVDDFPRTDSGKVQRERLKQMLGARGDRG